MQALQLDDFKNYYFLSQISYAPDGKHAAFVASKASENLKGYDAFIYVIDTEDNSYRKLTSFGKETTFIWYNNDTILFPAVREEALAKKQAQGMDITAFYKININGGEAQKAFEIPRKVGQIKKIGEKSFLFTGMVDYAKPDFNALCGAELEKALSQYESDKDYDIYDELPYMFHQRGIVNLRRNQLFHYDENTGAVETLSPQWLDVSTFDYCSACNKAAFAGTEYQSLMPQSNVIYLYDFETGERRQLLGEGRFSVKAVHFFPGKKLMLIATPKTEDKAPKNPSFWLLDLETAEVSQYADFDCITHYTVTGDSRKGGGTMSKVHDGVLYFVTTLGNNSVLARISNNHGTLYLKKRIKDDGTAGSVDMFDIYGDKALIVGLRNMKLQEVYEVNVATKEEKQITFLNEEIQTTRTLSAPQPFNFVNKDGVLIYGWVIKPVGYEPGKKYRGMLQIHGGPKNTYSNIFIHEMQYFANQGYFVFYCNPRGGEGRGVAFSDLTGKWGTIDYEDLMEFTDKVLEAYPDIDRDNTCVIGGSYGGFMTNWIIGHTDRFKAACSQRGIASWATQTLCSDIGYFWCPDLHESDPWNNVEKMLWHSPVSYANQVKTPTLVMHSDGDMRTWISEGYQMYSALKMHKVPTRLVVFHGETHDLCREGMPKHRIKRLEEITRWFNEYMD